MLNNAPYPKVNAPLVYILCLDSPLVLIDALYLKGYFRPNFLDVVLNYSLLFILC